MTLLEELKERRTAVSAEMDRLEDVGRDIDREWKAQECLFGDLDTAIRALDPLDPPIEEEMFGDEDEPAPIVNTDEGWELEPALIDEPDDASEFAESEGDVPNEIEASASGATLPTNDACALPGGVEESRDQSDDEAERAAAIELTADVEPEIQALIESGEHSYDEVAAIAYPEPQWNEPQPTEGYAPVVDNAEAHIQAVEAERYAQPTNPDADFWARGLAPAEPEKKHRFSIFGHKRETEDA